MEKKTTKSSWKHFYENTILNQFRGLLEVMGPAAIDLEARYKSSLKFDSSEGYDEFDKDTNMAAGALTGVGTALIIGTDDLIKRVKTYNNGKPRMKADDNKAERTLWEDAIIASGNYVRHGHEWHKRYIAFLMQNEKPAILPEERQQLVQRFLTSLEQSGGGNTNTGANLRALERLGIQLDPFLFSGSVWTLALLLKLNDIEYSLQQMRDFLNSHHQRANDDDSLYFAKSNREMVMSKVETSKKK